MMPTHPARLILRNFLSLLPLILLVNQSASLASSTLTPCQKIFMAKTIGFCLYVEGIMTLEESHAIVNRSLSMEGVSENQVNPAVRAKYFESDLEDFIDVAGGCKRVVTVSGFK